MRKNQKGQGLIEYLVIVALVAVGAIAIMRTVGQSVNIAFAKVAKSLGADVDGTVTNAKVTQSEFHKKSLRNFMNGAQGTQDDAQDTSE